MQLLHAQREDGKRAKKKQKEQQMKTEKEQKLARTKAKVQQQRQGEAHSEKVFVRKSDMADSAMDDLEDGVTAIRVNDEVDMLESLTGKKVHEQAMFS